MARLDMIFVVVLFAILGCTKNGDSDNNMPSLDAGTVTDATLAPDRDDRFSCCDNPDCPEGLGLYDDAGVDEYVKNHYGYEEWRNNPIPKLYIFCFTMGTDCETYDVNLRLPIDTDSIPTKGDHYLFLFDCGSESSCQSVHMPTEFYFDDDEQFDKYISGSIDGEEGWKLEAHGVVIRYDDSRPCTPTESAINSIPRLNFFSIPRLNFFGSLENAEFIRDRLNRYENFIEIKDAEGNTVALFNSNE